MLLKSPAIRSKKLRDAARGEDCTIQSTYCNGNPETSVGCHINAQWANKGYGCKADDTALVIGCSDCHRAMDNGELEDWEILRALVRTIRRYVEKGVLKIG